VVQFGAWTVEDGSQMEQMPLGSSPLLLAAQALKRLESYFSGPGKIGGACGIEQRVQTKARAVETDESEAAEARVGGLFSVLGARRCFLAWRWRRRRGANGATTAEGPPKGHFEGSHALRQTQRFQGSQGPGAT
jgi:hypothetical protein